jgi:hypothetical protein
MQKPAPRYSSELVFGPERDTTYVHFEKSDEHPFQANPTGFPRVNAWWLADAALLSYWGPAAAAAAFARAGLECEYIEKDSTDCYVAWKDDWLLIAFRGTEPDQWQDILADANIPLVPWQAGKVHLGFKLALDAIWPSLSAKIQGLSATRTVWFCGHSLGAALATLAADRFDATRGVCTFGSPRVGGPSFAAAFSARLAGKTLRYVNGHDIVTHVPPPVLAYKHVDDRRVIAPDGTVSSRQPTLAHFFEDLIGRPAQLLEMMDRMKADPSVVGPTFLLDHMPKAYAIWAWNDYDANG